MVVYRRLLPSPVVARALGWVAAWCVMLQCAGAAPAAIAATSGDPIRAHLGEPREAGRGALRFLGLRVYEAVLWVPGMSDAGSSERAAAVPPPLDRDLALELIYAIDVSGIRIAERSDQEIARQPDRGTAAQRVRWLEQMRMIFPDVRAGDRIKGLYRVEGPTRFFLNGKPLGEIDDPMFGRAFFGIWLDARTSEPALREALLRGLGPTQSRAAATPTAPASR